MKNKVINFEYASRNSSVHNRTKQEPFSPEVRAKMSSVKRSLRFQDDVEKSAVDDDHDVHISSSDEMPRKDMRIKSPIGNRDSSQAASSGLNDVNGKSGIIENSVYANN